MSQGLTWIAARRMPLVALVALLALTVGLCRLVQQSVLTARLRGNGAVTSGTSGL